MMGTYPAKLVMESTGTSTSKLKPNLQPLISLLPHLEGSVYFSCFKEEHLKIQLLKIIFELEFNTRLLIILITFIYLFIYMCVYECMYVPQHMNGGKNLVLSLKPSRSWGN